MASFYRASVKLFLQQSDDEVLGQLSTGYARRGYTSQYSDQTLTWKHDLAALRLVLEACWAGCPTAGDWVLLLEFSVPRKEVRLDAVLLMEQRIVILEAKIGLAGSEAKKQVEEYALLLHYFHKGSDGRKIVPVVVSAVEKSSRFWMLRQQEFFPQLASYWIAPVQWSTWKELASLLLELAVGSITQIDGAEWDDSPYFPVPSIIEAATALRSGLSIRDIAQSEASEHEIHAVCATIQQYLKRAREQRIFAICFLTGVPGSGKTLVGLSLAHSEENKTSAIHFMSGNGPLVKVLQHHFTQEGRRARKSAPEARTEARTLIENVHVFARYYTENNHGEPSNHAIIFDEAQRAWNRAQNMKKFRRDYSEPEMLLRIMERHLDWAMIIALVGGGQEINDGEAGLEEWGRALAGAEKDWEIYASPEVVTGGPSTAGHRLFDSTPSSRPIHTSDALHLRTSNRSLRAERLATWVNFVLDGDSAAAALLRVTERFPIFLSRDLTETRRTLKEQAIGHVRYGLVGSSNATRLRAEGLEPSSTFHADYPWEHWYLGDAADIRSSYRCEVFATEFEIQGLELDWIGLCWGGDFVRDRRNGWSARKLQNGPVSKWSPIKNREKQEFRRNAYRVLLTRARQGMVLFVPKGSDDDPTVLTQEFDQVANLLFDCGAIPLPTASRCGRSEDVGLALEPA